MEGFPRPCVVQLAIEGVEGTIRTVGILEVGADSSVELRASWIDESDTLYRRGTITLREPRILAGDGLLVGAYASSICVSSDGLCEATFRCSRLIRGSFGVPPEQLEQASTALWTASFVGWKGWAQVQFGDPFRLGDQPFDVPESSFIGPVCKSWVAAANAVAPSGLSRGVVWISEPTTQRRSRQRSADERELKATVELATEIDFSAFADNWLRPLASFAAFCCGRSLPVELVRAICPGRRAPGGLPDPTNSERVILDINAQVHAQPNGGSAEAIGAPIRFGSFVNTPSLLGRWLNVYNVLGPRLDIFCGGLGAPMLGLGALGAFIERFGFVASVREHVLHKQGGNRRASVEELLRPALDDLVTTLGVGDRGDEIGDRMIEARHYVLHMASARREAADAYRTQHSESMVIYADVLAAIAYNDVLRLLGFVHREERADIVGRATGFVRSYFGRSTPRA